MTSKKRRKIKRSRHLLPLRDHLDVTKKREADMLSTMTASIYKAFPEPIQRRNYIVQLINGLEEELAKDGL